MSRRGLFERRSNTIAPLSQRLPRTEAPAASSRGLFAARAPIAAAPISVEEPAAPAELERRIDEVRAEVEREGAEAMRAELDAIGERLATSLERLDRAIGAGHGPRAVEVVELALVAAQEIVGHIVRIDRERLLAVITEALTAVGDDAAPTTVHLAPEDLAWLREHRGDAFAHVRLVEDARIEPGGCLVETARRFVDASLEARMDAVRRAVHGALAEGGS